MKIKQLINWWGGSSPYIAESELVFDRMATELPANYKTAIDTFIRSQVALNQWDNVKECWLFANDTQANSIKGWIAVDADLVNSPTHSASTGITVNGSNQYISTNYVPSVNAAGFNEKLAVGGFLKENLSTTNDCSLFGSVPSGGAGHIALTQTPSSAGIYLYANTSTFLSVAEGSNDDKIFDNETEYTAVQLSDVGYFYKDGLLISSAARADTGLSSVEILFGATLSNITPFRHLNSRIAFGYIVDPTGFDFRGWHLGLKTMLTSLGVYSATPELTIPTGGEWFDFSQDAAGTFVSLPGRKAALTAVAAANAPNIETHGGVQVARFESASSEAIDLASVFQTFYDGTLPSSFSVLVTVKPIDGSPASEQAFFGHTNTTSSMYARLTTDNKIKIGFKEPAQAAIETITDFAAFNNAPTNFAVLIFEFLKDEMIVEVNGVRVNQTETSWGTRALTDFVGGAVNMYLGAENVDGVITRAFDGYIGDFMIRRGAWSQSQKERLYNYFD